MSKRVVTQAKNELLSITKLWECLECLKIFENPADLPCKHRFCVTCVEKLTGRTKSPKCPLCQKPISNYKIFAKVKSIAECIIKLKQAMEKDTGENFDKPKKGRPLSKRTRSMTGSSKNRTPSASETSTATRIRSRTKSVTRTNPKMDYQETVNPERETDSHSKVQNWLSTLSSKSESPTKTNQSSETRISGQSTTPTTAENNTKSPQTLLKEARDAFFPKIYTNRKSTGTSKTDGSQSLITSERRMTLRGSKANKGLNDQLKICSSEDINDISQTNADGWRRVKKVGKEMKVNTLNKLKVNVEKPSLANTLPDTVPIDSNFEIDDPQTSEKISSVENTIAKDKEFHLKSHLFSPPNSPEGQQDKEKSDAQKLLELLNASDDEDEVSSVKSNNSKHGKELKKDSGYCSSGIQNKISKVQKQSSDEVTCQNFEENLIQSTFGNCSPSPKKIKKERCRNILSLKGPLTKTNENNVSNSEMPNVSNTSNEPNTLPTDNVSNFGNTSKNVPFMKLGTLREKKFKKVPFYFNSYFSNRTLQSVQRKNPPINSVDRLNIQTSKSGIQEMDIKLLSPEKDSQLKFLKITPHREKKNSIEALKYKKIQGNLMDQQSESGIDLESVTNKSSSLMDTTSKRHLNFNGKFLANDEVNDTEKQSEEPSNKLISKKSTVNVLSDHQIDAEFSTQNQKDNLMRNSEGDHAVSSQFPILENNVENPEILNDKEIDVEISSITSNKENEPIRNESNIVEPSSHDGSPARSPIKKLEVVEKTSKNIDLDVEIDKTPEKYVNAPVTDETPKKLNNSGQKENNKVYSLSSDSEYTPVRTKRRINSIEDKATKRSRSSSVSLVGSPPKQVKRVLSDSDDNDDEKVKHILSSWRKDSGGGKINKKPRIAELISIEASSDEDEQASNSKLTKLSHSGSSPSKTGESSKTVLRKKEMTPPMSEDLFETDRNCDAEQTIIEKKTTKPKVNKSKPEAENSNEINKKEKSNVSKPKRKLLNTSNSVLNSPNTRSRTGRNTKTNTNTRTPPMESKKIPQDPITPPSQNKSENASTKDTTITAGNISDSNLSNQEKDCTESTHYGVPSHIWNVTADEENLKQLERDMFGSSLNPNRKQEVPNDDDDDDEVIQSSLDPQTHKLLQVKEPTTTPRHKPKDVNAMEVDEDDRETLGIIEATPTARKTRRSTFYLPSPKRSNSQASSSTIGPTPYQDYEAIETLSPGGTRKTRPIFHSTPSLSSKIPVPLIPPEKKKINITYSKMGKKSLSEVEKFIEIFDGTISPSFNENVTHVLVMTDDENHCEKTFKYIQGIAYKKWVLSYKWIVDCLQKQELLNEEIYEVYDSETNRCGARKSRKRERDLFQGFAFYFIGSFPFELVDFQEVVQKVGAMVVLNFEELHRAKNMHRVIILDTDGNFTYKEENIISKMRNYAMISYEWVVDSISQYQIKSAHEELFNCTIEDALQAGFPKKYLEEPEEEYEDEECADEG